MARALVITPRERALIKEAIARAAKHPISIERMKGMHVKAADTHLTLEMRAKELGADWKRQPESEFVPLPVGYLAAISFEEQPIGMCRHLSISVDRPGALPHPEAVKMIMEEFGCTHAVAAPWVEEFKPGHSAINIVALSDPPAGKA
jgi:hypothetical protein